MGSREWPGLRHERGDPCRRSSGERLYWDEGRQEGSARAWRMEEEWRRIRWGQEEWRRTHPSEFFLDSQCRIWEPRRQGGGPTTTTAGRSRDFFQAVWEAGMRVVVPTIIITRMQGPIDRTREIRSLQDLPPELWKEVDKPKCGYNFRTEVGVGATRLIALFDSGASTNGVSEEVVIGVVNEALSKGLTPEDEAWPVKFEVEGCRRSGWDQRGKSDPSHRRSPFASQIWGTSGHAGDPGDAVQDLRKGNMRMGRPSDRWPVAGSISVGTWTDAL